MTELKQIFLNLKYTGDTAGDGINISLLKDACLIAANKLMDIVNLSLNTGVHPEGRKTSDIV